MPLIPSRSCTGSLSFPPLSYFASSSSTLLVVLHSIPLSTQVRSAKMGPSLFLALGYSSAGCWWFVCIPASHTAGFYDSRVLLWFTVLALSQTGRIFLRTKIFEPISHFHDEQFKDPLRFDSYHSPFGAWRCSVGSEVTPVLSNPSSREWLCKCVKLSLL